MVNDLSDIYEADPHSEIGKYHRAVYPILKAVTYQEMVTGIALMIYELDYRSHVTKERRAKLNNLLRHYKKDAAFYGFDFNKIMEYLEQDDRIRKIYNSHKKNT